jgi:hypothetical protein
MTTGSNHDIVEKLEELALRCEAATGPDAALNEAIVEAFGWRRVTKGRFFFTEEWWERGDKRIWRSHIPNFTASLDAAMSLVPEDALAENDFAIERNRWDDGQWVARFDGPSDECGHGDTILATAATPALALTAAALRVRALQSKDTRDV